jgi:hypothetical protein
MFKFLAIALLSLTFVTASCRGHSGAAGAAGTDGGNGQNGGDGSGLSFSYVRGIDGANILDGVLIISASLVVPKTILDLAPPKDKVTVADGVQLVIGMPQANVKYYLVPVPKGDVLITATVAGKTPQNWKLPFDGVEYLALVPINSVIALALDPSVIAKGALIELPKHQYRPIKLFIDSICVGEEIWVRW